MWMGSPRGCWGTCCWLCQKSLWVRRAGQPPEVGLGLTLQWGWGSSHSHIGLSSSASADIKHNPLTKQKNPQSLEKPVAAPSAHSGLPEL